MGKSSLQIILIFIVLFFSCREKKKERPNTFAPKVIETKGYLVPKDSVTEPKVILAGKPTIVKAGKPTVILTNTNIHIAINTNIHLAGTPRVCTPGKDTFLLPKTVPALDTPKLAAVPEVTIAKDPHINDNNPQSFSSFSKLQGLKHSTIGCMLQDKSGNLWFGTSGGVSKYDGKSFTHFTEKEGLSNNIVLSMLEDKSGNLWFGTYGGVSKYDGKSFTHFTEKEGLSNNFVRSILEDKSGNLWFGTSGGVSKYDGKSFTHFTEKEGLSNNTVLSMLEDKSGNLWFGTSGGGVSKYDGNRVEAIEAALQKGEIIPERTQQDLKKINGKLVKSFTHFTEKEGLSNNVVRSILEDKSGNLWFGTSGGISKYDGKTFTHFTEKEGLSNNNVRSILEDKVGNLWFGTYGGGVSKYDGNRVEAIEAALQKGEIIPERTQQDLKKINGKLVKSFTHFTEKEGLSNNIVWSILGDKSGNLWFGTDGGVSKYDGKSFTHFTEKEGLSNNNVWSMLEDKSGNLWFGTSGGVSKYDGKSFTHFTEKEGLSNNTVYSMLEDKNGNLWFGTSSGVSKYDGKSFTHLTEKEGLSNNFVFSMLEDKSGNLWFGTYGGGVSKYDGNRVEAIEAALQRGEIIPERTQQGLKKENGKFVKSFTHFTEKEGLSNNIVRSILEDKSGNLWFGTYGGVSKYDGKSFTHFTEKEGLSNNTVWSMLEDKSGNLWFGTSGGVSKYDGNRVEAIEAALQRGGTVPERTQQDLKKINGKLVKSFTHFTEKEGLSNNTVLSMLEDKSGNLWFGSRFGLSKLSPGNKEKLVALSGVEGSDSHNPYKVVEGTSYTEVSADKEVFFKNYTYEDGFLGIGVNGGKTICEDKNGTIWVAANDRLTAYHPEGEIADTVAPNIQLTSIALFNENIAWVNLQKSKIKSQNSKETNVASDTSFTLGNGVNVGNFEFDGITKWYSLPENLSLAYNNNYLTFNFIGITQKQNKKVKYQYKLEGIDENWSAITNRTEAPYGNLPQGNYTFKVKAMNSEGYWSNEFNYTFTIRPPWWKTWWFRTFVGLIIICSVWYYIKSREKKLVEEKEILERTVEERTEELVQKNIVVEKQKHLVEEKQREIIDSINYAKRIQQSQLPTEKYIDKSIKRLKKD